MRLISAAAKGRALTGALVVSACMTGAALADCDSAIASYNSALSEISSRLSNYTRCLSNSEGEDDCTWEFRRLRSAQGDFEDAVASYGRECES